MRKMPQQRSLESLLRIPITRRNFFVGLVALAGAAGQLPQSLGQELQNSVLPQEPSPQKAPLTILNEITS